MQLIVVLIVIKHVLLLVAVSVALVIMIQRRQNHLGTLVKLTSKP